MNKVIKIAFSLLFMSCQQNVDPNLKVYGIEDFFDNVSISGGYFSTDEEKIIFSSNQSGIFNVYEANIQTGKINQLTASNKESFFVRAYVPNSNDFIYSADNGGNEINHLFLKKEDDTVIDLTPSENEKSVFYKWSNDNQFLYYLSNKRDSRYFDLYKMKIGQWIPEIIYKNEDNFSLSDISNDEKYLLLSKSITTSENKFYLFDINENKRIEISSLTGSYSSAGFSNDNTSFLYITDINNEFSYLNKYDIESMESSLIYETEWDVMYSYLSKNEKYRIIGVNEDGKNSVKVIEVDSNLPIKFPSFNNEDISSVSFSESEQKIRLTVGSSKMPSDLFVYDIEAENLKKITNSLNPKIDSKSLVSAEVIRYKSFDGLEIPAIYYKPLSASKKNKVPALVWIHGGPGGQSRMGFNPLIQYLTN
ncbi:MAG: S9 family peptidase, partial [Flavobacteriaceae bacterium]|nr:S9 family peptidase [Flavobacteriaceae bacterium]